MRDSNAHLDGVQVEYNEKFPNGLMYPADPQGQPSEVYNCRCTLIADVLGMRGKRTSNTVGSYENWLSNKKISNLKRSSGFVSDFRLEVLSEGVKYNQPKYLPLSQRSDASVVKKISIKNYEDELGSCTSLAFAYIGNAMGLNVVDSRQDKVTELLQQNKYIKKIANLTSNPIIVENFDDYEAWNLLKKQMQIDKKYVLSIGEHTAIVGKNENGIAYLDLQRGGKSGWKKWNKSTPTRFGFHTSKEYKERSNDEIESFLFDCEELQNSSEFEILLGFIHRG